MKKDQANCVFTKGVGGGNVLHSTPVVWGLMAFFALSFPVNSFAETSPVQATQTVQQQKTVKGSILDENGEPMIGVSVVVKGTTTGTVTDFDGNFSLSVPANTKTLEISYIGYKTQNVTIGNAPLSIKMQPDNKLLDEVVVIGYGTIKKRDLTGAVSSIKSEDITLSPTSRPMDALQGKIAGLDITKSSGQAGSSSNIQLRGVRSMQYDDDSKELTGGSPTYIIDGMPGDINSLNPNDIESIEVLKDASSTAVYGSSGANGVIIVTTKQASTGKPVINLDMYTGFTTASKTMKMRSGDNYIKMFTDANKAAGYSTDLKDMFTDESIRNAITGNQWVDWADEVLHDGTQQNVSLSVTGGTDKTKAYFSLNYSNEESLYKDDNYQVYSSRFRIDQVINKWITAGVNAQASYTNKNARSGVYETALFARPLGIPYNEDGSINKFPIAGDTTTPNILADEQPGVYKNNSKGAKIYVDAYVDWKPIKGLSIRSQLGGNYSHSRAGRLIGEGSYNYLRDGQNNDAIKARAKNSNSYNYKWENILTYNFTLAEDHAFTVTGVTSYNYNRSEGYTVEGTGIENNKLLWYGLNTNSGNKSIANDFYMSKGLGYVGRVNYSYKGKYLASISCRWDGSSRLSKDNRWDSFPAMSLGWRISDESFMDGTKGWLDNLKIRAGYGVSGTTSGIGYYPGSSSIVYGAMSLGGEKVNTVYFEQKIANPDLTWEKSYNLNIGLDASFLNNRIDLTLDYYDTKTKDVIMTTKLPNTMGGYNASTPYTIDGNYGKTRNRGIELALTTRNIVKKDFTWTSNITFAKNKEEITQLAGNQLSIANGYSADKYWVVGEAIDAFYGYEFKGIWQYSERETAALFGCKPGDVKLSYASVKKDGDGYYYNDKTTGDKVYLTAENPYSKGLGGEDRVVIGKTSPDWTGGFKNTFTYKDFDFSFFLYARWGQMMKFDKVLGKYTSDMKYNIPNYFTYYDKTIEADQDVLFYAADASVTSGYSNGDYAALNFTDASFWKLKNVTLGYTLPKSICSKLGIGKLRVYGTATNLFVYSPNKYVKNYDPEMNGSIDFPLSKEFVFGLNLTF